MGNVMKRARAIGFVSAVAIGGAGFGATWTNVTDKEAKVSVAANWQEGVAPAFNDASSPVDVSLAGNPDLLQTVAIDSSYVNGTWHIGKLEGSSRRRIALNNGNCRRVSVSDASDFFGYFRNFGGWCGLYAAGDAGTTHTARQVVATGRFTFGAAVGVTQTVERLFGYGRFDVNEKYYHSDVGGTVEIVASESGPRLDATVNAGKIVLHGVPYAAPSVVGDPFLHLDASQTGSLAVEKADGRTCVRQWNDVRGNGLYAAADDDAYRPFLSDGCVNFGSYVGIYGAYEDSITHKETAATKAELGPSAYLRLSSVRSDIREVFLVFRDNAKFGHNAPFFGAPEGEKDVFRRTCRWIPNVGMLVPNLFGTYGLVAEIAAGDVRVDGVRNEGFSSSGNSASAVSDLLDYSRRLHVVSVGLDGTAAIDRIAANGYGTGGLRIAEVILYTNVLSSTERRCVNAYLRAKWQDAESSADRDLRSLKLNAAELEVPSGNVRIGRVELPASAESFTKIGGGLLAVENGIDGVALRIDGGELSVGEGFEREEVNLATPAALPDVWFNADVASSYDAVEGVDSWAGTVWAKEWRDVRDGTNAWGQVVMAEPENVVGNGNTKPYGYGSWPTVKDGPFGRKVLDFGTGVDASEFATVSTLRGDVPDDRPDAASFVVRMSAPNASKVGSTLQRVVQRTSFVAVRKTAVGAAIFGGEAFNHSTESKAHLDSFQSSGASHGGLWTKNGKVFDASADGQCLPTNEWMVVGVEMAESVSLFKIAQRSNIGTVGGLQIGEMLCYDRLLTPAERRQTEAYLMRRWVDADYEPEKTTEIAVPSVTFGDGVAPVLGFDCDAAVGSVAGASGTLVKKGKGAVTVAEAISSAVDSVEVLNGGLAVKMNATDDGDGAGSASLDSLVVSNGTFSADMGGGSLNVDRLSIAVTLDGKSYAPRFAVEGTAAIPAAVTLDVSEPEGGVPVAGEYVIFSADAVDGADTVWTCDFSHLSRKMSYNLVKRGNSVAVCVNSPALRVIVR